MIIPQKQFDKLQWMFGVKFIKLTRTGLTDTPKPSLIWDSYLLENNIEKEKPVFISSLIGRDSVAEHINKTDAISNHVILSDPASSDYYLFVPFEFAEKALVLGFLP